MLILSRRTDETIIIGDDIKVKILSISRNQVRIGIDAPDEVSIMREELYNKGISRIKGEFKDAQDR